MKRHFDDEQISLLVGEALSEAPDQKATDEAWAAFARSHRIGGHVNDTQSLEAKFRHRPSARLVWWAAASVAVAAMVVGLCFVPWGGQAETSDGFVCFYAAREVPDRLTETDVRGICTVSTPPSATTTVKLGDGTVVTLSANSTLTYPATFKGKRRREVTLEGEAWFKVAPDKTHPFSVEAGKMRTNVLGTTFIVRAYKNDYPVVALIEGRVNLTSDGTSVDITPGQKGLLADDGIMVAKANMGALTDWMRQEFDMDNTPLSEALESIASWYNMTVVVRNTERMEREIHFRFSRKAKVEEVVEALNDLNVASLRVNNRRIEVE